MISHANKYKTFSSIVFLCSYLFLFSAGIFHFHNPERCTKYLVKSGKNSLKNDPFGDGNSFCLLSVIHSSLHLYFHSDNECKVKYFKEDAIINNIFTLDLIKPTYNFSNFRAPPAA